MKSNGKDVSKDSKKKKKIIQRNKDGSEKKLLDELCAQIDRNTNNNSSSNSNNTNTNTVATNNFSPEGGFRCGLCLKDELTHRPLKKTYKFLGLKSGDTETTPDGGEVEIPRIATINVCQGCAAKVHLSGADGLNIVELRENTEEYRKHKKKEINKSKDFRIQPLTSERLKVLRTGIGTVRAIAMAQKEIEEERIKRLPKGVSVLKAGKASVVKKEKE